MHDFYPNPMFIRDNWYDLNGEWEFAFDDENKGVKEKWYNKTLPLKINVPYVYQCEKSGINDKSYHPVIWYRRTFELPALKNKTAILSFGGVDFHSTVYINGNAVKTNEGGYNQFDIPITEYVKAGENTIAVRVEDYHDISQCRGKQIWTENNHGCWYTASSGIWKSVWIQLAGEDYIESVMITPDLDNRMAHFEIDYPNTYSGKGLLEIELLYNGNHVSSLSVETEKYRQFVHMHITQPHSVDDVHTWSPEHPNLYTVKLKLHSESGSVDTVETYFGMRKIDIRNGQILLNNRPLYQKLILDQGYWDDGLLTAPSREALKKDIELTKAMGFNGIRKHQKIEDSWFYRYADEMGVLVWAELPSPYGFSTDEIMNVQKDMTRAVKQLYNHPSVITWVPFNESWGVRDILHDKKQQDFVKGMYYLIKALDPVRLISANDGWEHPVHDFIAIHDYEIYNRESYDRTWADFNKLMNTASMHRQVLADCDEYRGTEPVMLTEFGGIALQKQIEGNAWGYRGPARDEEELINRLDTIMKVIYNDSRLSGFCYTQLTDVQQEVNGLLDSSHNPKCDVEVFRKIFSGELI